MLADEDQLGQSEASQLNNYYVVNRAPARVFCVAELNTPYGYWFLIGLSSLAAY